MIDVYKNTTDNWYPSFKLEDNRMLVKVSFMKLIAYNKEPTLWRVCVWGNDDCGMEQDFETEKMAWCCFLEIIGLEDITREALTSRNFQSA